MKKNYWSIFKNSMALWEFSFEDLDKDTYTFLVLQILKAGKHSKLFCAFEDDKEIPLNILEDKISKFIDTRYTDGIGSIFYNFSLENDDKLTFCSYFWVYDNKGELIEKKFAPNDLRNQLELIEYEYLKTNIHVDELIKINISSVKNFTYLSIQLFSDIWLPIVKCLWNKGENDLPSNQNYDNYELAVLNSYNLNILLNDVYNITYKLKGSPLFDFDGTNSNFRKYIKNGKMEF